MSNLISGISTSNPTAFLKGIDTCSIPEIDTLSDRDFQRFVYTGISAKIDVPLVKDSKKALFAVHVDGFIPPWNNSSVSWMNSLKNLFPVQPLPNSLSTVKIFHEMVSNPIDFMYNSHRFYSGNVGIGMRISSNTAQTGNFIFSQASGLVRRYYNTSEQYAGLQFLNSSSSPIDYAPQSFTLGDISLNRNISITPIKRDPVRSTDLAKKLQVLHDFTLPSSVIEFKEYQQFASQFQEDWLFVGILSDLPNSGASQITVSFFFDYSKVQFYAPLLPYIPMIPNGSDSKQIMHVSETLNSSDFTDPATGRNFVLWSP